MNLSRQTRRSAAALGLAILTSGLAAVPASALVQQCFFISKTNKLYYVVMGSGLGDTADTGVQVTSVVLTGGTVSVLTETATQLVITAAAGAPTGDILHANGMDVSGIKRTAIISNFDELNCSGFVFDDSGDGALQLPGPLTRRVLFNNGNGGDPGTGACTGATCLPLVPIDTSGAPDSFCADGSAGCRIPAAVRTTVTRSLGMSSIMNAPTLVFPNRAGSSGPITQSDANLGEVDGQNATLDETLGSRIGNDSSALPSQPGIKDVDGFYLRRECATGCDLVVFVVDDGAPGFGVAASGFAVDSFARVLLSSAALDNNIFNAPTPSSTATATATQTATASASETATASSTATFSATATATSTASTTATATMTPTATSTSTATVVAAPICGPDGVPCSDGNACTTGDTCANDACISGPATNCDDGDACTTDSCNVATGCAHQPTESTACGNCSDCVDNDGDGDIDSDDVDCDPLPGSQLFAVVATATIGRDPTYLGSNVTIAGAAGMCPGSDAPFPGGPSGAGLCGHDMAIRAGGNVGIIATQHLAGDGISFGQGQTGKRDISIRSHFVSNGGPERIKRRPPFVGPGRCGGGQGKICSDNDDCPGRRVLCENRSVLNQPGNPLVDRSGTAIDYQKCLAALAAVGPDAARAAALPGNVAGFTGGTRDLRTNKSRPVLTIQLGHGLQVIHTRRVSLNGNTEVRFVGFPDTTLVIRVAGPLRIGGLVRITLAGGLTADHVLWTAEGSRRAVSIGRSSVFRGTLLAAARKRIRIGGKIRVEGALIGQRVHINQRSEVVHYPFSSVLP